MHAVQNYFAYLYETKIIDFEAYISWKDDQDDQTEGKTQALIKPAGWLVNIEEAAEEERRAAEEAEEAEEAGEAGVGD